MFSTTQNNLFYLQWIEVTCKNARQHNDNIRIIGYGKGQQTHKTVI